MKINYFNVFSGSLLASTLVLTSCLPPTDTTASNTTASNTMKTEINGSWSDGSCEDQGPDGYFKGKTTINSLTGTVLVESVYYSDANCLTIIEEYIEGSGWFTLGEAITTVSGLTAIEIDSFETEEMLTPSWSSIYRIDGDLLYFGDRTDNGNPITPENRPTSLDFENPMTRI